MNYELESLIWDYLFYREGLRDFKIREDLSQYHGNIVVNYETKEGRFEKKIISLLNVLAFVYYKLNQHTS